MVKKSNYLFRRGYIQGIVLIILALLFLLVASATADSVKGDINSDGVVNINDVVMVMKHVLNVQDPPLTAVQRSAADVNSDGIIDVRDVIEIMKTALMLVEESPKSIISIEEAQVKAALGTTRNNLNLPATVKVRISDDSTRDIRVSWEQNSTPLFNPDQGNEYLFKGTLSDLPAGLLNPLNLQAQVIVILEDTAEQPAGSWPAYMDGPPKIAYIDLIDRYEVTITIKPEFKDRVKAVTVLGEAANRLPAPNDNRWRYSNFKNEITLDDLLGKIELEM